MDTDLTELVAIDPTRIDGVKSPASGMPFLIMKSKASKDINSQGGINEAPDIHGAETILIQLFKLIEAEAREGAVGNWNEIWDICTLVDAAQAIRCFMNCELQGSLEEDGENVAKSEAVTEDELTQAVTWICKRKIGAAERKRLASEGKALEDGSYPIENEEDLHNAAILARSGHGDVAAAKRLIAKRAKELGKPNPLAQAAKDAPVTDTPESTETPEVPEKVEKSTEDLISEAVEKALEKATAPLLEANEGLRREMEVLKATPLPGGPSITRTVATVSVSHSAEIAKYRELAKSVGPRDLKRYYEDRASELEQREAQK